MHLQPDTLLQGRYRVIRLIAQGGMGAVYQARDERLGSTVALKQTMMADPALREAFAREARLLAGLQHPALPVVSDHFTEDGGQFLVMQFIPGDDLARLLHERGGPFPVAQVLAWAEALLDALDYLHGQQPPVIHRDIKPLNLKLAPHGGIILLDFGLAKGAGAGTMGPSPSLYGYTPQYAPIEQIQGSGTDARSDLYALAATLAELLTGAPPPDALTRASAGIKGEPDPLRPAHELNPLVPAHVSAALQRALALNPAARPPSAAMMRADLRSAAPAQGAATGSSLAANLRQQPVTATGAATGPTIAMGSAGGQPGRGRVSPLALGAGFAALLLVVGALALGRLFTGPGAGTSSGLATAVTLEGGATPRAGGPPPTPLPDGPGTSLANPVPFGQTGAFGSMEVRVLDSQRGREAWNAMRKANQFNDLPPEGYEYFLVKLALSPGANVGDLYPRLAGDRRVLYAPGGVSPAPLPDVLVAGQPVEAWVPYVVAIGEGDLVLHLDVVSDQPGLLPLYLAANEGARLEPDPAIEAILPDEQGLSHGDPAPLGATVTAEDYALTVLEVRRGQAALAALIERYSAVERPREGYEFALVRLRVRYLGDGGVIGYAHLGPSDFGAISVGAADPAAERLGHPGVYILPDGMLALDVNMLPGGTYEGWTVLELPANDEAVALAFSPGLDLSNLNTRFLALQEGS